MDPFNAEAQKKIEDIIRQENVTANLEQALEYHPESFGQVTMLYIPCEINGYPVKVFVDCGAQTTISTAGLVQSAALFISFLCGKVMKKFADRCGVSRLIDSRFAGMARGVGVGTILGKVHSVIIKVGKQHLPCSLTILDGDGPDVLFGLDMLKRHQVTHPWPILVFRPVIL